ncbi:MAG: amino acid adenylation domain-containing protein [Archangium sp.]
MNDTKNVEAILPVTPLQQGMLFQSRLNPGSGVYVVQLAFELEGPLDVAALRGAWERVVERHGVHRTLFLRLDSPQPLQIVRKEMRLPWRELDWRDEPAQRQEARFQELMEAERTEGFEPSQAPLMRLVLIRLSEQHHRFLWSRHHAISDGWSLPIVMREVLEHYEAHCKGERAQLPPARSYREYVSWLGRQDRGRAERFWKEHLAGLSGPTPLVVDRRVGLGENPKDTRQRSGVLLSAEATAALQELARREQLTLNTLTQAAWALLLSRYSGQEDVGYGFIASGRPASLPGVEEMVGCLLNTLPARVRVDGNARLLPWLKQQQLTQVEREEHGYTSLTDIRRWSGIAGTGSLFESLVVFENYPLDATLQSRASRLRISGVRMAERTSFPLMLTLVPGERLSVHLIWDDARFDAATIERMLGHYQTLLTAMAAAPGSLLAELPLMPPAEEHRVRVEWNDTRKPCAREQCLHHLFEAQAARKPDAVAAVWGTRELTYGQLETRANQLARCLLRRGVGPGARVGICMPRDLDMLVGLLGILKTGAAYVPVDSAYPAARIAYLLADARPHLLLSHPELRARLPTTDTPVLFLDEPTLAAEAPSSPALPVTSAHTAYVIYTSGSTGHPKGVMLSHANAVSFLAWAAHTFSDEELAGTLAATSLCFDLSVFELFLPLARGTTVILADNALALSALPARGRVTLINTVPSAIEALVREGPLPPSVRVVNLAGEALSRAVVDRVHAQPSVDKVYNLYGPTECTTYSTGTCVPRGDGSKPTIGGPIANTRAYVLDEQMRLVPIGVPGELYLGGDGVAQGYLERPALTAERFVADPFSPEGDGRLYRTGDRVRWLATGGLEYLDRLDRQVKLRGFRIELGEIEAALRQQPDVADAVAVVREDTPGHPRLVGYVVPAPGAAVEGWTLGAALRSTLPEYMVPGTFVTLAALPLTPNGKVDRKALPAPESPSESLVSFVAPRSETEQVVARIWAAVLSREKVGVNESFFEIGGDSLLVAQVHGRLREAYPGKPLTLTDLFKYPTVRGLAEYLAQDGAQEHKAFANIQGRLERRKAERDAALAARRGGKPS